MTDTPKLPQAGGTFIIGKDGKPRRESGTTGPLDPAHPDNQPAPAAPVSKEKTP